MKRQASVFDYITKKQKKDERRYLFMIIYLITFLI